MDWERKQYTRRPFLYYIGGSEAPASTPVRVAPCVCCSVYAVTQAAKGLNRDAEAVVLKKECFSLRCL